MTVHGLRLTVHDIVMKSICFISLGCPKNQVDSEVMLGSLIDEGYVLTDDPTHAEIIIVNTCAFIEDARTEAVDTVLEMAEHKKSGTCDMLVVAGCLPERYRDELAESMPEVDIFIGVNEIAKLPELIHKHAGDQHVAVGGSHYLYNEFTPRVLTGRNHAAYIKIAEGCFHACSFCIIPRIRGKFRSREIQSVVAEAKTLIEGGVKELNLIAQDTTAYGHDLENGTTIAMLMDRVADLPGEKWVRLLYSYPHNFPDDLIRIMKDRSDIVKYLDIPIQHVSRRVLESMRREGDASELRKLIDKLRLQLPGVAIRTSLIVGYPGETEREFEELLDFVCEMKFDHLGAFLYSLEEGTAAADLKSQVPRAIAESRRDEIMRVQQEISRDINQRKIGKVEYVLVEGPSEETEHLLVARHAGQAPDVDGVVYINEGSAEAGKFALVEITDSHDYDLIGRVL